MTIAWASGLIALSGIGPQSATSLLGQSTVPFVDVTSESGLNFTHMNGAAGDLLLPEVIGAGGALFDYDNDGDLDLFAVQGVASQRSRLYRNDRMAGGSVRFRFTDVTERSGIVAFGSGMGTATGDLDNDGWTDLYVTYLGANRMFRNNGDGTFADVTAKAGVDDGRWSTSATFFDYDRDGWLDLFVANYVNFRPEMKRQCFSAGSARDYCNPAVYDAVPDRLFHNNRNGTFSDVSTRAGFTRSPARGLGVLATDVNGDDWIDLYVANDGDPNQLWINQGESGSFKDDGLLAGVAVGRSGEAQGSMGIDAADIDGDGDEDLFVTNLDNEANTLYRNIGQGLFEDRTVELGLFKLGFTGFGTRFMDYDNDGWLDLIVANGAVRHLTSQTGKDPYPLKQRSQLFRNDNGRRFVDVSASSGGAFSALQIGRGVATGDLDNDGDTDVIAFNNSGPARVLMNNAGDRQHWIGIRAVDGKFRRDVAQARIVLAGKGRDRTRRIRTDGSYASASDPRVLFGLGPDTSSRTVRVHWGRDHVEEFRGLEVDRYWLLESGKAPRAVQ
jgi:enediyne biosynthesis protein E4